MRTECVRKQPHFNSEAVVKIRLYPVLTAAIFSDRGAFGLLRTTA
jgi:hypothetical protein